MAWLTDTWLWALGNGNALGFRLVEGWPLKTMTRSSKYWGVWHFEIWNLHLTPIGPKPLHISQSWSQDGKDNRNDFGHQVKQVRAQKIGSRMSHDLVRCTRVLGNLRMLPSTSARLTNGRMMSYFLDVPYDGIMNHLTINSPWFHYRITAHWLRHHFGHIQCRKWVFEAQRLLHHKVYHHIHCIGVGANGYLHCFWYALKLFAIEDQHQNLSNLPISGLFCLPNGVLWS